jgi:hypothetical protein
MLSAIAIAPDYEYSPVTKVTFLPLFNSPVLLEDDFTTGESRTFFGRRLIQVQLCL